tara:strand:+ start:9090 stop:9332 length:243 start_codon:yes stop_codon:yes gene_type:complete
MKKHLTLKAGTIVRLSELGHKNFYYPGETVTKLLEDCEVDALPWIGSLNFVAIKIPTLVLHLDVSDKSASVVWVSKDLLN